MRRPLTLLVLSLIVCQSCLALKCYICDPACDVEKASKKVCGEGINLTSMTDLYCVTEFVKGEENTGKAVRKCAFVSKGQQVTCKGTKCDKCTTDLCNKGPEKSAGAAPSVNFLLVAANSFIFLLASRLL